MSRGKKTRRPIYQRDRRECTSLTNRPDTRNEMRMVASVIFNVIDTFLIEVPMFPLSLVKIGQILKKIAAAFRNPRDERPPY